jgi:hypothetical protein
VNYFLLADEPAPTLWIADFIAARPAVDRFPTSTDFADFPVISTHSNPDFAKIQKTEFANFRYISKKQLFNFSVALRRSIYIWIDL